MITPNLKTSGRAVDHSRSRDGRTVGGGAARDFLARLYRNVPVLDAGAGGATITFAERGLGDVLVAWESGALMLTASVGQRRFEIVVPSASILAEPPVALVDRNVDKHGTRTAARAYLEFLYSEEGQEIAARNHYRPRSASVASRHAAEFPKVALFTVDEVFGGWGKAQKDHFDDGGVFDQVATAGRR